MLKKHSIAFSNPFLIIILIFPFYLGACFAQEKDFNHNHLPLLGNSDQQYLTKSEANKIGRSFYNQILSSNFLITDIEINLYLSSLITKLHNSSSFSGQKIRILIINNDEVNAFALPGNIIVIHSGLLLTVEKESELTGVLAHELSHLKQQHLLRLFTNQKKRQPQILLTTLAALILAPNSQVTNAALSTGFASAVQNTLDYTRKQEYEADRVAIDMLLRAGFDPNGIVDFFEILAKERSSSNNESEFLRTHPLSHHRISEAKNRVAGINRSSLIKDSKLFQRIKLKLALLLQKEIELKNNSLQCFEELIKQQLNKSLKRNSCSEEEISQSEALIREHTNVLSIRKKLTSTKNYEFLIENYPGHIENYYALFNHLYNNRKLEQFIKAVHRFLKSHQPVFPDLYKKLSKAYYLTNQTPKAKYFLAKFNIHIGRNKLAKQVLIKLKETKKIDRILLEKVNTLLESINVESE